MDQSIRDQLNRMERGINNNGGNIRNFRNRFDEFYERFKKVAAWLRIPQIINALTLFVVLHNAVMLSGNIVQTLGDGIGAGLAAVGLRDDEGNPYDVNQAIGSTVNDFIESVIGEENWQNTQETWKRANRIYQAGANIIFSVQSIGWSITEALETVGNYVAKIGNAARAAGVVMETAYSWMNPNLNFQDNRFLRGLNEVQDGVDAFSNVTSEMLNVRETIEQFDDQSNALQDAIRGETPGGRPTPEHQPTSEVEADRKAQSQGAAIATADLQPGGN